MPPGLVTRTISASMAGQSPTCSSTLDAKQTLTAPEASGRRSALPRALPESGRPWAASSPRSVFNAERPGPVAAQFPDEEAGAAADVDDHAAGQAGVLAELADSVRR